MSAPNPFSSIQELSAGYFASRCLHVAAELGVADALDDKPMQVGALAAATKSNPDALSRILRLLETHGVFKIEDGLVYHTPASLLLRSDHPTSMRDFSRMFGLTLNWRSAELGQHCGQHLQRVHANVLIRHETGAQHGRNLKQRPV